MLRSWLVTKAKVCLTLCPLGIKPLRLARTAAGLHIVETTAATVREERCLSLHKRRCIELVHVKMSSIPRDIVNQLVPGDPHAQSVAYLQSTAR